MCMSNTHIYTGPDHKRRCCFTDNQRVGRISVQPKRIAGRRRNATGNGCCLRLSNLRPNVLAARSPGQTHGLPPQKQIQLLRNHEIVRVRGM